MREIRPIVLFVDDEELARRTFERMVEKEFRVLLAEDVKQAMQVLDENHEEIGILLSDQRMPGQLGVDLLEYCRSTYPDIIRMLTTAYSELNDAIAAVNRGEIMRYIEKPWGNIDSILVDLKLAATLYEIKKENQQLIDEKLAVGFKTSQMEKIRTLITVAACQNSGTALTAVESMLRQIADEQACYQMPDITDLRNYQMFGQPLGNTISAIELGVAVHNQSNTDGSGGDTNPVIRGMVESILGDQVSSQNESSNEGSITIFSNQDTPSICLKEWFSSYEVSAKTNKDIATLLTLFIFVYQQNGTLELGFNENGLLHSIKVNLLSNDKKADTSANDSYDWIDDLMILFN